MKPLKIFNLSITKLCFKINDISQTKISRILRIFQVRCWSQLIQQPIRQLLLKTWRDRRNPKLHVGIRRGKKQRISFPIVKQFPMRVDRKSCLPNHEARNIRRGIFIGILEGVSPLHPPPSPLAFTGISWRRRKKEALVGIITNENKSRPPAECNGARIYSTRLPVRTPRSVSFISSTLPSRFDLLRAHFRQPAGWKGARGSRRRDEDAKRRERDPLARLILARLTPTGTCSESGLFLSPVNREVSSCLPWKSEEGSSVLFRVIKDATVDDFWLSRGTYLRKDFA